MAAVRIGRRGVLAGAAAFGAVPPRRAMAAATDVVYWHTFVAQDVLRAMQAIAAKFEQANPNVRIAQDYIPNSEYMTKVTNAVLANSRPDVAAVTVDRFPDLLAMNG